MSNIDAAAASRSLLASVEEAVCRSLGICNLRHRSPLLALRLPGHIELADLVFCVISDNWNAGRAAENMGRARQNWRRLNDILDARASAFRTRTTSISFSPRGGGLWTSGNNATRSNGAILRRLDAFTEW